jgi:signal transduction histidine kinase
MVQPAAPSNGTVLYGQPPTRAHSVAAMDITVGRPHPVPARRPPRWRGRVPWSPRAWLQALYLAGAIPAQVVLALGLVGLIAVSRKATTAGEGALLLLLWLAALAVMLLLSPVLTRVQRHRLRTTAGVVIAPGPRRRGRPMRDRIVAAARSESTWRQLGYHLLAGPLLAAAAVATLALWPTGIVLLFSFYSTWSNGHPEFNRFAGPHSNPAHHPVEIVLMLAGLAALFAAPWFTSAVRALDSRAARGLLGPSRADELASRVEQLTETRAGVVDAADAERRRLERDLHDGTQQRLVSLAMNLGMARAQAGTADEARLAIAAAHEEAKAALAELRDLIRGLHPAVLEDRGLDAALSGVAARMPIPVRLTVDLPRRPAPVIEAVAYFVVSEGLANIVKHAQATEAAVFVQRSGDRLHVIVTDDGVGGADPARGTGLAGLARRAASVDGTFDIDSPPGGPTLLTVDLPCNR